MIELLWFLLPVAAVSGWYAAQRHYQHPTRPKTARRLSPDYFKGLNYLLNEQPDKAIDVFIKLIDIDSNTVETHLALGVLFRRRGEVNRAIRLHQNLISRPSLSASQRHLAILELAQDYRHAGLLDRAEACFEELAHVSQEYRVYAQRQLLAIYQQEHDWQQAIDIAKRLQKQTNQSLVSIIAHFYCELAESAWRQDEIETADKAVRAALETDKRCVRASLLAGKIAMQQKRYADAVQVLQQVERQDPDYLSEVIEPLRQCYLEMQQENGFIEYLQYLLEHYSATTPALMLADCIKRQQGVADATTFVMAQLHKRPSLRGLDYLLSLGLAQEAPVTHNYLMLLKEMTQRLMQNKPIYKCRHCGFTGKSLHWQCPSCKQWNTVKPIQGIDGE